MTRRLVALTLAGLAATLGGCNGASTDTPAKAPAAEPGAQEKPAKAAPAKAGNPSEQPAEKPASAAKPAPAANPAAQPAAQPVPAKSGGLKEGPDGLPPSDRIFTVSLDAKGAATPQPRLVLGASGTKLWAADPGDGQGKPRLLWTVEGLGVVQKITAGDLGQGLRIYVARGQGRGHLTAPLVVQALDPTTGQATELWRNQGPRPECAHMSIADVDRDGAMELAFAYYESKYMVKARHLEADGSPVEGQPIRMASTWTFGDLDGDGKPDGVVGRVYGDAKGEPGDLKVDLGKGPAQVPTDNGVRGLAVASVQKTPQALYFADGWVANYGKEAKAQIKAARWQKGKWAVETIASSPDEFTFFDLTPIELGAAGQTVLVARGNKRVSALEKTGKGWALRPLAQVQPVLNTAVGQDNAGGWRVYVPNAQGTRVVPFK